MDESRLLLTQVSNSSDTATISRYGYAYDELGRRTSVVNEGNAFAVQPRHNSFDYNDRGEITGSGRFEGDDPSSPGTNVPAEARLYAFDNIGNRLTYEEAAQTPETSYTTNNLNQYTVTANPTEGFTYDDDGNLLTDSNLTYTYDGENRLVEVAPTAFSTGDRKVTYSYDYMGRRLTRKVFTYGSTTPIEYTKFIWDGWLLVAELDGNNNDSVLTTYLWGLDLSGSLEGAGGVGGLLAARKKSGTPIDVGFLYDGNGNVTQVVDLSDESVEAHYEYDPFGQEIVATGNLAEWNKFRFSTKYLEDTILDVSSGDELGLYYYGYRYYSPRTGRWINRDPIGERGGNNLFSFIFNSPLNSIEYLGLWKIERNRKSRASVIAECDKEPFDKLAKRTGLDMRHIRYWLHPYKKESTVKSGDTFTIPNTIIIAMGHLSWFQRKTMMPTVKMVKNTLESKEYNVIFLDYKVSKFGPKNLRDRNLYGLALFGHGVGTKKIHDVFGKTNAATGSFAIFLDGLAVDDDDDTILVSSGQYSPYSLGLFIGKFCYANKGNWEDIVSGNGKKWIANGLTISGFSPRIKAVVDSVPEN